MAEPFLSEIRVFAFDFAPKGWAACDGQLLPINQNQALFSLLGTTFGGDGRVNFALPDLRERTAMHAGAGYPLGARGGEVTHTLTISELPVHTHSASGSPSQPASRNDPKENLPAAAVIWADATSLVSLNSASIGRTGGGQPHPNLQPYLALNYCIAIQGLFPSPV